MMSLLSESGLRLLESVCFARTLFAFDFDGTLARIEKDPAGARIAPSTLGLLLRLNELAPVAVISGRTLADLKSKFSSEPAFLVGNHGLQGLGNKRTQQTAFAEQCQRWRSELEPWLQRSAILDGVELEDKCFSLAIHFRNSRAKGRARMEIRRKLGELAPAPKVIPGKCVFNVVPEGGPHKGVALLELMRRIGVSSAFYIGDDDTDEDVFTLPDDGLFTARVGRKAASAARFYIDRQRDVNELLARLIEFHRPALQAPRRRARAEKR
ncbi:MAG TPA: trehalose-phosphatase [Bdellovibrionales bacterium]|nr:trehalose-phosphatase [Bdellovibrionales bacterium]